MIYLMIILKKIIRIKIIKIITNHIKILYLIVMKCY